MIAVTHHALGSLQSALRAYKTVCEGYPESHAFYLCELARHWARDLDVPARGMRLGVVISYTLTLS